MGQVCTATFQIFVQDTIWIDSVKSVPRRTQTLAASSMRTPTTHHKSTRLRKRNSSRMLRRQSQTVQSPSMEGHSNGIPEKEHFVEPTVFATSKNCIKIVHDEVYVLIPE
ncbi:hypothetical protein BU23DRAFT_25131 [Bimuria novae-zelandiae CBS 107.79]|uniref:Aldehyde dehydrogenase domain-containing protein n=1 Tax=Bimuria novae-zelandiae CBS 107.79 TaxID=1447943 RepID=A0A6A5URB6_9PLEO|nr:hypothetical protein BU23DRAFT_25131 [Bimuria novae-zelandiae CBS 107.79]